MSGGTDKRQTHGWTGPRERAGKRRKAQLLFRRPLATWLRRSSRLVSLLRRIPGLLHAACAQPVKSQLRITVAQ